MIPIARSPIVWIPSCHPAVAAARSSDASSAGSWYSVPGYWPWLPIGRLKTAVPPVIAPSV